MLTKFHSRHHMMSASDGCSGGIHPIVRHRGSMRDEDTELLIAVFSEGELVVAP